MTRIVPICANCGSDDLARDATARWSIAEQRWELSGVFDDATCQECGHDSHNYDEREATPEEVLAAGMQD